MTFVEQEIFSITLLATMQSFWFLSISARQPAWQELQKRKINKNKDWIPKLK